MKMKFENLPPITIEEYYKARYNERFNPELNVEDIYVLDKNMIYQMTQVGGSEYVIQYNKWICEWNAHYASCFKYSEDIISKFTDNIP